MNRTAWILVGLFVVLVVVLIFVFGGGDDDPGTTTIADTSTSVAGTTSTVAGTTTIGDGTTSTSAATTTTTPGTTTIAGLEGNWADSPIVVAGFGALGWWDGSSWVAVEEGTTLPVSGGEDYQVAFLGVEAVTTGGGQEALCEPLNNPGVALEDEELLGDFPGPYGVAISAPWELVPHLAEEIEDGDGSNSAFAREVLAGFGLDVPEPPIKQLLRVDLEGDGVNEIIVVAEDVTEGLFAEVGDYSLAFLRKTVGGSIQDIVLGESVITDESQLPLVYSFSVGAVADLNGDAKMEIVVSSAYYEGLGVEVWEYVDDSDGAVMQISQGCGA
jgi:hypothetical protein